MEGAVPRHVAIVMDGNGRWAQRRGLPRAAGHKAGVAPVRAAVRHCVQRGIGVLTLFAFSSENFQRPPQEVGLLMQLLIDALGREVDELDAQGVRLRFIGDRAALSPPILAAMDSAMARTAANRRLELVIAIGYGGRWDIVQAARQLVAAAVDGELAPDHVDLPRFAAALELGRLGLPDPDRRRAAHQQFPALEPCLRRVVVHRRLLAGVRRTAVRRGTGGFRHAAATPWFDG